MFIFVIVFLAAATESLHYVKILNPDIGMGGKFFEIITFDKPSVSHTVVLDKVNNSEYVTFRKTKSPNQKLFNVKVISPGKSVMIDDKNENLVQIDNAEIVLELGAKYVASIFDMNNKTMLLDNFMWLEKTATVGQIWDATKKSSDYSQSMWESVTEIHVEAPGPMINPMTITKQTPKDTTVQVENAKFFVKIEAEQGVIHMAPFWWADLNKDEKRPYKVCRHTGVFRFRDTHMTVQGIWDAVKLTVAYSSLSAFTLAKLRIEMAKGTKSLEVKLEDKKENVIKIDVTTITDVIYGLRS